MKLEQVITRSRVISAIPVFGIPIEQADKERLIKLRLYYSKHEKDFAAKKEEIQNILVTKSLQEELQNLQATIDTTENTEEKLKIQEKIDAINQEVNQSFQQKLLEVLQEEVEIEEDKLHISSELLLKIFSNMEQKEVTLADGTKLTTEQLMEFAFTLFA